MPGDRDELRATFELAAERYELARPDYPEALFEELVRLTGVAATNHRGILLWSVPILNVFVTHDERPSPGVVGPSMPLALA